MNPNTEMKQQELTTAVEHAKQTVSEQEITTQRQEAEAHEIEMKLLEAQELADRQESTTEKGKEAERRIESVGVGA